MGHKLKYKYKLEKSHTSDDCEQADQLVAQLKTDMNMVDACFADTVAADLNNVMFCKVTH